jgi:hypothetical protein
MIEVIVRDGRAMRDRSQDTEEGGAILATLQRDQPYEIGDAITLADGAEVAVIGDSQDIQPGQSWKQTVFVGERRRPRRFTIDAGGCPEWTLQSARDTTTFVRCVDADEAEQIKAAAVFCRKYATLPTYRLLSSSFRVWRETFDCVANAKPGEWDPALADGLLGAFVGWLLIWRLVLDQAAHDLSSRFGNPSDQLSAFRSATKRAYDTSRAYRVVEALRNLVQHQEMPTLKLSRIRRFDPPTGQPVTGVSYRFPMSDLLNSSRCPATIKNELRNDPEIELELPVIIDEAMAAINAVLVALADTSIPELATHIIKLRKIFTEASGAPLLLRIKRPLAGSKITGLDIETAPLHDLQFLVQNAPISDNDADR